MFGKKSCNVTTDNLGGYTEDESWENTTCPDCEDTGPEGYVCTEMVELIKQIRNRCDILLAVSDIDSLCPETLIEDIYEDAQELLDFCVEEDA